MNYYRGPGYERERPRTESHNQLLQAQQILDEARQEAEQARQYRDEARRLMSQALWCDPGKHAYSAKDPDAQQFERRYRDTATAEPMRDVINVCGEHLSEPFRAGSMTPEQKIKSLENSPGPREE